MSQLNPFIEWRERYYHDPVAYVREVLGAEADAFQAAVVRDVASGKRRISLRSGHGVGKTTVLAWLICWFISTRYPQKTVCTAPTEGQLFDALAAETKAWIKKMPPALRDQFEIQAERIFLRTAPEESFVSFKTSRADKPEAMAGVHSDHVLLIGDEASGIPEKVFEAAAGSMSGHNACTILAGNPIRSSGLFYASFHDDKADWSNHHISCRGHPRIAPDFVAAMLKKHGERSNEFRIRVLGEFPLADDDTIIPAGLAESALLRDVEAYTVREIWGVDVARFGADDSALARRKGNVLVKPVECKNGLNTMQTVGWVKSEWDKLPVPLRPSDIFVDVIGIGAGVCDRLAELGLPARGINVSESPAIFDERYDNQRTELWYAGKDWLELMDVNLANDTALKGELIAQKYEYTSSGKLLAVSKKVMKSKWGKASPNRADALLLTLSGQAVTAISGGGGSGHGNWGKPLKRPGVC